MGKLNGLEFHAGERWSGVEGNQKEPFDSFSAGGNTDAAAQQCDTDYWENMTPRIKLAYDDLNGGRKVRSGLYRANYFKGHDPCRRCQQ